MHTETYFATVLAGLKDLKFQNQKGAKMVDLNVTNPAQAEWESSIGLVAEMFGSLWLGGNNKNLKRTFRVILVSYFTKAQVHGLL